MKDSARLQQLLDELLDTQATPEEVCAACPELLPEVRLRWLELQRIQADLDALFPSSSLESTQPPAHPPTNGELPDVPGYEVLGVLGQGGVGVVYRACHLRLQRPVALKMLLAGAQCRTLERERFEREAAVVASLGHVNIVPIYDVGDVDGQPYYTMELIEGGSLAQRIHGVPQPARQAVELMVTLAEAVQAAHEQGVVHRDLKPGNILLAADGKPKITDFGLARRLDSDADRTLSGAPVGTPSYMSPEQVRGDMPAIGPATDIYALGAILYELLTGRPPFRAETTTATLQQVVADEPVPPRRLNPRAPRDLETICLKCLQKDPSRRYDSAHALAEELRRFQRGEAIKARPVGTTERLARWARRRPALAVAIALGFLLASVLLITLLRWQGEQRALQASAVAYAEADLSESQRLLNEGDFKASSALLQRAKERLVAFVPTELHGRLTTAFEDLQFATRLDAIRTERAVITPPSEVLDVFSTPTLADSRNQTKSPNESASARRYEEAFRDAGIGEPGDDPNVVALRVKASQVSRTLVAALDDWAACASDRNQQVWILAVARKADPDPWRDRVRDPATWDDSVALRDLADRGPVSEQSPQLLAVFGARLRANDIDAVPLLTRVATVYPNDFWANIETGNALLQQSKVEEAAAYYRAALSVRPGTTSIHYALGCMYLGLRRWDPCLAEFEQAIRLDPENAWCYNRLGVAFQWMGGRDDEAIIQFRKSIRLDPKIAWTHHHLAVSLEQLGHFDEAVAEFQEAIRLAPDRRADWKADLRRVLVRSGRGAEAVANWKHELAARPSAHAEWHGYAELCLYLGDETEYRRLRSELLSQFGNATDPYVAERVGRACLLMPGSEDELRQAAELTKRAVDAVGPQYDWIRQYFHFAHGLAQYRQGQFDDCIKTMAGDASKAAEYMGPSPRLVTAMALFKKGQKEEARDLLASAVNSYDWNPQLATKCEAWIAHILRREAEAEIITNQSTNE